MKQRSREPRPCPQSWTGPAAFLAAIVVLVSSTGCPGGGQPTPLSRELVIADLGNQIVVYDVENDGKVTEPPSRIIYGPSTGLHNPMAVSMNRDGEIFAVNLGDASSGGPSVTIYAPGATGNAAPTRTIQGSGTGMSKPNAITAGSWNGILVTNHVDPSDPAATPGVIEFSLTPGNDVPTGGITGGLTTITGAMGIGRDEQNRVFVAEPGTNRILGYEWHGESWHNEPPDFVVEGPNTLLDQPMGVAFDSFDNMYVVNRGNSTITVYPPGVFGDVSPTRRIGGPGTTQTLLSSPEAIAVDKWGHIYVSQTNVVLVFDDGANGGDAPMQVVDAGDETVLSGPLGLIVR